MKLPEYKKAHGSLKFRYDYDYLVCFQYKDNETLHGKLFGHVLLYRNVNGTSSIKINPTINGTLIIPYTANVNIFYKSLLRDYNCYIYTVKHEDVQKINVMFGVATCVSIVKNMLGIRAWWIITPRQLERYIQNRGK